MAPPLCLATAALPSQPDSSKGIVMSSQKERSAIVRSAIHSKESGSADHDGTSGSDQRIGSGSLSLRSLAARALSAAGADQSADHRTDHERSTPPDQGTAPAHGYPVCPHVTDPELAEWYAENPKLTCARCWLEAKGGKIRGETNSPPARSDASRKGEVGA